MRSDLKGLAFKVEGEALVDLYRFLDENSAKLSGELETLYYNIQNEFYDRFTVAEFEAIKAGH